MVFFAYCIRKKKVKGFQSVFCFRRTETACTTPSRKQFLTETDEQVLVGSGNWCWMIWQDVGKKKTLASLIPGTWIKGMKTLLLNFRWLFQG